MGGKIWLESEVNIGTVFHFTIPLKLDNSTQPNYEDLSFQPMLILSKNKSVALQLAGHLRLWNIPLVWHNTANISQFSVEYLSQFKIIFLDTTKLFKPLPLNTFDLPSSSSNFPSAAGSPLVVAIVTQHTELDQEVAITSIIQMPVTRSAIERVVLSKDNGEKIPMEEPWLNFEKGHPLDILLVDDNQISLKVTTRMLNRMGYHNITVATDGTEAVTRTQQKKYDLILMDIQMPTMSGIEATKIIRQYNRTSFICALSAGENKQKCLDAGMNRSLLKPFTMQRLFEVVQECNFYLHSTLRK